MQAMFRKVFLYYLVGSTDILLEKSIVNRVPEIQRLKEKEKQTIYTMLDALIQDFKNKQAYGS